MDYRVFVRSERLRDKASEIEKKKGKEVLKISKEELNAWRSKMGYTSRLHDKRLIIEYVRVHHGKIVDAIDLILFERRAV